VPRNPYLAAELGHRAAAAGYPQAQFNLALAYERGYGVPRDYDAAARWYAEAGNRGVADAAFALSELYRTGRGVPQHDELAGLWLEVARKFGSTLAVREEFAPSAPTGDGRPAQPEAAAPPAEAASAPEPTPAPEATTAQTAAVPAATAAPAAEPAAAATPPAETAALAAAAGGAFAVQLASLTSESDATRAGASLKAQYADQLGALDLFVRGVDLGADKGTWYRVLAGPFAERAAAAELCARLRAAPKPVYCLVVAVQ
jgi:cell division septation protein DedD